MSGANSHCAFNSMLSLRWTGGSTFIENAMLPGDNATTLALIVTQHTTWEQAKTIALRRAGEMEGRTPKDVALEVFVTESLQRIYDSTGKSKELKQLRDQCKELIGKCWSLAQAS